MFISGSWVNGREVDDELELESLLDLVTTPVADNDIFFTDSRGASIGLPDTTKSNTP
jgi:hypothetical protein